jgi:hypothetical protein|tara:strand:- start:2004 stop:2768 length:765 start_codon:yes stop_codon:yes gene_type:complete
MNTCIFINSSDNTYDIASIFLKSYSKYIINNPLQVFMGINKKKHLTFNFINYIEADKSNWKDETLIQLNILKNNFKMKNVILILDDFIFNKKKNCSDIYFLLNTFDNNKLKYLSLKKLNESKLTNLITSLKQKNFINKLRFSYPYYSSLQIAVWDIDYLIDNIKSCTSIWSFEHLKKSNNHFQVRDDYFSYNHIVEKGEWNYYTPSYVKKYVGVFNPGNRKVKNDLIGFISFNLKAISFFIFGFSISKLKKLFT